MHAYQVESEIGKEKKRGQEGRGESGYDDDVLSIGDASSLIGIRIRILLRIHTDRHIRVYMNETGTRRREGEEYIYSSWGRRPTFFGKINGCNCARYVTAHLIQKS